MEDAIRLRATVCVVPALQESLLRAYPAARVTPLSWLEVGDAEDPSAEYRAAGCACLVATLEQPSNNFRVASIFCTLNLYAVSLISQLEVSFPVRPSLASSVSYWSLELDARGTPFRSFLPFAYETCDDVAMTTASSLRQRRRLSGTAGRGSVAGATVSGPDGAAGSLAWTERGGAAAMGETEHQFTVNNLGFVLLVWSLFAVLAVARSLFDARPCAKAHGRADCVEALDSGIALAVEEEEGAKPSDHAAMLRELTKHMEEMKAQLSGVCDRMSLVPSIEDDTSRNRMREAAELLWSGTLDPPQPISTRDGDQAPSQPERVLAVRAVGGSSLERRGTAMLTTAQTERAQSARAYLKRHGERNHHTKEKAVTSRGAQDVHSRSL